jgi:hypothetical protein
MKRESNIASSIEIGEVRDLSAGKNYASPRCDLTKKEECLICNLNEKLKSCRSGAMRS